MCSIAATSSSPLLVLAIAESSRSVFVPVNVVVSATYSPSPTAKIACRIRHRFAVLSVAVCCACCIGDMPGGIPADPPPNPANRFSIPVPANGFAPPGPPPGPPPGIGIPPPAIICDSIFIMGSSSMPSIPGTGGGGCCRCCDRGPTPIPAPPKNGFWAGLSRPSIICRSWSSEMLDDGPVLSAAAEGWRAVVPGS